jgi:hypothetical protein
MYRVLVSERTQHHPCNDKRKSKPAHVSPTYFAPISGNLVIAPSPSHMKTERQTSKDQKLFHVSLHSTVSQNLSKNVGKPKAGGEGGKLKGKFAHQWLSRSIPLLLMDSLKPRSLEF